MGLSLRSGVAPVLGVIVNVGAAVRHFQLVRQVSSGAWIPWRVSSHAVMLGVLLADVSLAVAVYLTLVNLACGALSPKKSSHSVLFVRYQQLTAFCLECHATLVLGSLKNKTPAE